jgi:hypothetical protein
VKKVEHKQLQEDVDNGVRVFFLHEPMQWDFFQNHPKKDELEIFFLDKSQTMIQWAREVHEQGGNNIQELAELTLKYIQNPRDYASVYVDSAFFQNIAKIRAMKLLINRVNELKCDNRKVKFIALNSYREWTLYERYSNMLRNDIQVASALIAGADIVQSSGYQVLFDLVTNESNLEHDTRSSRMARNTSHIMALESMLGMVEDAAFGSYHLESLSHHYAGEAWNLMQRLLKSRDFFNADLQNVREERLKQIRNRKHVLVGINDFPDAKERLNLDIQSPFFRTAQIFEELRLKVEGLKNLPHVEILLEGGSAVLSNRINFIKNYFELIGLVVTTENRSGEKIIVLCSLDENYPELAQKHQKEKAFHKYVAGKIELPEYDSIFAGQDVYAVLKKLVSKLEAR